MFTAALLTITNYWIKKLWHIHTWSIIQPQEWNYVVCKKMDWTADHHVKQNKLNSERILSLFSHVQYL
jgi:hypothetical protein